MKNIFLTTILAFVVTTLFGQVYNNRASCGNPTPIDFTVAVVSDFNGSNVSCYGECDGEISVTVNGGAGGPYGFELYDGSTTVTQAADTPGGGTVASFSNLCANNYNITVIDSSQLIVASIYETCTESGVNITQPADISMNVLGFTNPSCPGSCDGQIFTSIGGGTGTLSIFWVESTQSTANPTSLCAGDNTVQVTDENSCFFTDVVVLSGQDNVEPTGTAPANLSVECSGDVPAADPLLITDEADNCDPSPIVTFVSDATDGNSNPETITRTYRITDASSNFVDVTQTITIQDTEAPTGTAPTNLNVECFADVPAADPFIITDETDNCGIPTVTHQIDVSDNASCPETITRTYRVTDDAGNYTDLTQLIIIQDTQDPTGTAPADVTVACNADIPAADPLLITDEADNCSASPVVAYVSDVSDNNTSPEVITRTYSITDDCGNSINVQQIITVSDPTCGTPSCLVAQYDFSGNADDASGNGNHGTVNGATLTTDRFGNANSAYNFQITNTAYIESTISNIPIDSASRSVSCWFRTDNAGAGSSPNPIFSYGDAPFPGWFELHVNNGQLNFDPYANGCVAYSGVQVNDEEWHHSIVTFDDNTNTLNHYLDGELIATNSSACVLNTPFSNFFIGRREPTAQANFFNGDIDDIKILGCVLDSFQVDSIYQAEAPAVNCGFGLNQSITQPTCNNTSDGAIDLMVGGGQAPITYDWSNGETTQDISNLQPGQYSVIITDANGCDTSRTYTVAPANVVGISVNVNNASCGNDDGSAFVSVNQGTAPYEYAITSGDTTNVAQNLGAGYYNATVTDANGCSASQVFVISDSDGPTVNGMEIEPTCPDDTDGGVNIAVVGGATPYTYSWSDGTTIEDISGVGAGTYDVEVTDANGCVAMASFELTGGDAINLGSFTYSNPTCGNQDGEIAVTASGGNGTLSYQWSANTGSQTTATATNLGAGAYYLMVTDANGCTQTQSYMLSNTTGPTAVIQAVAPVTCNGNGGGINLSVTGGVPPFTYNWSNGATTQDLQNLSIGDYDVMVTDGNGCSDMITVNVPGRVPQQQEICVITVDSLTQTNLIVWEKPSTPSGIEYYKIYREGNASGVYNLADTVHYSSLSQWTDPTADPSVRGWRYKISAVDSCGNESPMSTYHKSIHLTINQGLGNVFNLIWDDYVGQNIPSWIIERYHSSTGWIILDTIPSNLGSYTDNNAPSQGNSLDYSVYGEPINGCTSTRANHNTTRSNQATGIIEITDVSVSEVGGHLFDLYPNPAESLVSISTDYVDTYQVTIHDLHGKLIRRSTHKGNTTLNVEEFTSGVYLIEIRGGDEELKVIKLIKN